MTEKIVLVLAGSSANDAISGLMMEFGSALADAGLPVVNVALEPTEVQYALDQMIRGNVRFGLTWSGLGQDLTVLQGAERRELNAWDATRVPLLKIHADHPAYCPDRHSDIPVSSVNLYMAAEFAHYRSRWLRQARALTAVIPPWPMAPLPRNNVDLAKRRKGTLVFLKNGNAPAQLKRLWSERLAPSIASLLHSMAEQVATEALKPGELHLGDFVADVLANRGIDPEFTLLFLPFFVAQLDDYTRRLKSEMIAKALLDFPVIVQGNAWDHVDFSGRRATLVPGQDFVASRRIFTDELGLIDMSPNLDTQPHERVQRAAGSYSLVLTNTQTWLSSQFGNFHDLMFELSPESIKARIADVLAKRDRYLELAVAFGEQYRKVHPPEAFARRVIELGDLAALQCTAEKPFIQPFFIWPAP